MTDNIAALIKEVEYEAEHGRVGSRTLFANIAHALAGLTARPVPEEIAALIEQLLKYPALNCEQAADRLRSLARENERLKEDVAYREIGENHHHEEYAALEAERERLLADLHGMQDGSLLRDLRAENERLHAVIENEVIVSRDSKAECDAIRRKTIEECAEAARINWIGAEGVHALLKAEDAIRALAQAEAKD